MPRPAVAVVAAPVPVVVRAPQAAAIHAGVW